jgi:2-polyprenyl-3-methyl-5-hydroxy-6-metoxy-1,4-benzoquinol methylase
MKVKDVIEEYFNIYDKYYENGKMYGASSEDLLEDIAPHVIELNPKSILDYGCGRSSLINHFWKDGERKLAKYDPAVREYREMPKGVHDLVVCTDVMEHIPPEMTVFILRAIKEKGKNFLFTVSLIPARQKLSDGQNAHLSIFTREEWEFRFRAAKFMKMNIIKETPEMFMFKTW